MTGSKWIHLQHWSFTVTYNYVFNRFDLFYQIKSLNIDANMESVSNEDWDWEERRNGVVFFHHTKLHCKVQDLSRFEITFSEPCSTIMTFKSLYSMCSQAYTFYHCAFMPLIHTRDKDALKTTLINLTVACHSHIIWCVGVSSLTMPPWGPGMIWMQLCSKVTPYYLPLVSLCDSSFCCIRRTEQVMLLSCTKHFELYDSFASGFVGFKMNWN